MASAKNGGVQTPPFPLVRNWPTPPSPLSEKNQKLAYTPPPCQKSDLMYQVKKISFQKRAMHMKVISTYERKKK